MVLFVTLEAVCWWLESADEALLPMEHQLEIPELKTEGEKRIVFLGASTVEGRPYLELGFVNQLKFYLPRLLAENSVQCINRALAGRNSTFVLRKLVESLAVDEPDALVVMIAHNEFIELNDLTAEEFSARYTLRKSIYQSALLRRIRRAYLSYLFYHRAEGLLEDQRSQFIRGSARYQNRILSYRENMARIVAAARQAGVPLYLCTAASNLLDFPPQQRERLTGQEEQRYHRLARNVYDAVENNLPQEAISLIELALLKSPEDPMMHFYAGGVYLQLGEVEKARRCFVMAKDLDETILRGLSVFNTIVKELCQQPGLKLVDVEDLFFRESKAGVPGNDLFYDYCHPNVTGHHLIATELVRKFVATGLISAVPNYLERIDLRTFVESLPESEDPEFKKLLEIEDSPDSGTAHQ